MKKLNCKDFMKKYKSKSDTTNESDLQQIYNIFIFPRDSKVYADKGFVNIDNGQMGGTR